MCKQLKNRFIIRASMIERARQRMQEKQPETSFDVLIDAIYQQETGEKLDCALDYLHDWTKKEPDTFDNKYRNIQNFVSSKFKAEQKAQQEASVEKVDYLKIQQEYSAMIQRLIEQYGINPEEHKQTFIKKLISCIGSQESYLVYKNDRANVLQNKDGKLFGKSKPSSVFLKTKNQIDENNKEL